MSVTHDAGCTMLRTEHGFQLRCERRVAVEYRGRSGTVYAALCTRCDTASARAYAERHGLERREVVWA